MSTNRTSHPHRQYVFRALHDRRRIAQRLAASLRPSIVAALEGTREADIAALLGDAGFARLVRHYEELRALAPEARLARLKDAAMEVMELALDAGDVRVALFVMAEGRAGRHPAETLAKGVVRSIERAVPQVQMRPGKCKQPPAPKPDRNAAPESRPQAKEQAANPAAGSEQNFGFSAAAQPTSVDAQVLAMAEAEKLRSRIRATGNALRRRIIHEMERSRDPRSAGSGATGVREGRSRRAGAGAPGGGGAGKAADGWARCRNAGGRAFTASRSSRDIARRPAGLPGTAAGHPISARHARWSRAGAAALAAGDLLHGRHELQGVGAIAVRTAGPDLSG
jgi:hypothetical protein